MKPQMRVALKIFAAAGAGVPGAGARRNKAAATSPTSSTSSSASRRRNLSVPSPSSSSPAPSPLPSSAVVENSVAECVVSVRHVHEYRRNVGICLVNRHGKVFCARRVICFFFKGGGKKNPHRKNILMFFFSPPLFLFSGTGLFIHKKQARRRQARFVADASGEFLRR